jgi:hypothetical protein
MNNEESFATYRELAVLRSSLNRVILLLIGVALFPLLLLIALLIPQTAAPIWGALKEIPVPPGFFETKQEIHQTVHLHQSGGELRHPTQETGGNTPVVSFVSDPSNPDGHIITGVKYVEVEHETMIPARKALPAAPNSSRAD